MSDCIGTGCKASALLERIASLEAERDAMLQWRDVGESLVSSGMRTNLFALGEWWSDRPWRKRTVNQKPTAP